MISEFADPEKVAAAEKQKIDEYLKRTREIAQMRKASPYPLAVEEPEDDVTAADDEVHDLWRPVDQPDGKTKTKIETRLPKWAEKKDDDGYDSLRAIYAMALEQAQGGKGKERHANGLPFDQQPICQGGRRFGVGCLIYQAWKKAHETPALLKMDNGKERAIRELLGVINYAAAAVIVLQESGDAVE